MPGSVEVLIVFAWGCSVGFGGNDNDLTRSLQRLDHPVIGIKRFVGNDRVRIKAREQGIGALKIMRLSWGEMKPRRVAQCIACGMDFCGQATLAAPDGFLRLVPPFAPAACWWARTIVASIIAYSLSKSSARRSNTCFQTPRRLQRVWRV